MVARPRKRANPMSDHLSVQDATFVYAESDSAPLNVGMLAFFEDRGITEEALCRHVSCRLHRFVRLRQKLAFVPLDQGHPVWIDDEQFDVRMHVRSVALLGDRGEAEAGRLLARVMSVPLPRSRPLWEIWLFPMNDDRVGLIVKLHHCLLDGVSAVKFVNMLFDAAPDVASGEPRAWSPAAAPGRGALLRNALRARWEKLREVASHRPHVEPAEALVQRASERIRNVLEFGKVTLRASTRVPIGGPIGPERRFETFSIPLHDVRVLKNRAGCKVNDVALSLVAEAAHHQLERRGIHTLGATVKAAVPVSRHTQTNGELGNQVSLLTLDLPVGGMDPARRLRRIAQDMNELKRSGQAEGADFWLGLAEHVSPVVVSTVTRAVSKQRLIDLGVTNVAGPPIPLYLLGGRMLEVYPYTPLIGATSLGVAVSSYNGTLYFGISGDWNEQADLSVFKEGLALAWDALSRRLTAPEADSSVELQPRTMYPVSHGSSHVHHAQGISP